MIELTQHQPCQWDYYPCPRGDPGHSCVVHNSGSNKGGSRNDDAVNLSDESNRN